MLVSFEPQIATALRPQLDGALDLICDWIVAEMLAFLLGHPNSLSKTLVCYKTSGKDCRSQAYTRKA